MLVRILTLGDHIKARYLRSLMRAFKAQRIGTNELKTSLFTYFKKDVYVRSLIHATRVEEAYLMQERMLADKNDPVCHGCMSYKAQVTCPCCHAQRFCIGCADYGACLNCSSKD